MSTIPTEQNVSPELEARTGGAPGAAVGVLGEKLRRLGIGSAGGMRSTAMLLLFVVLTIYFNAKSGGIFLTADNVNLLIRQASVLAVVAAGTTAIMIMGEIDLSIGSAIYLTGLFSAEAVVKWHLPLLLVIGLTVCAGLVLGAFQGACVAWLGMPSFIVTLGGLLAFRGIGEAWSGAASIAPISNSFADLTEGAVADTVTWIGVAAIGVVGLVLIARGARRRHASEGVAALARAGGKLLILGIVIAACLWVASSTFGLPTAALWIVGVGGALTLMLSRAVIGRDAYLIGANREASFRAGLAVRRNVLIGFLISGAIYGIGGILLTARLDGSTASAGTSYELYAIAAAVLGGVSLRGGAGAVPGVVGGALLLSLIQNGMDLTSTSTFTQSIVEAGILLLAVALDVLARRRSSAK